MLSNTKPVFNLDWLCRAHPSAAEKILPLGARLSVTLLMKCNFNGRIIVCVSYRSKAIRLFKSSNYWGGLCCHGNNETPQEGIFNTTKRSVHHWYLECGKGVHLYKHTLSQSTVTAVWVLQRDMRQPSSHTMTTKIKLLECPNSVA